MSDNHHQCDAIVFKCMDWRVESSGAFREEMQKAAGIKEFDTISVAGGAKSILDEATRKIVMNYIDLSFRLHRIQKVVLTNHTECGAYGDSGTKEKLISDLREAKKILEGHFSGLRIQLVLIQLMSKGGKWHVVLEQALDKDLDTVAV